MKNEVIGARKIEDLEGSTSSMNEPHRQRLASRTFEVTDAAKGRSAMSYPSMNTEEIDLQIEIVEMVDGK
jgi:hypothetical protein